MLLTPCLESGAAAATIIGVARRAATVVTAADKAGDADPTHVEAVGNVVDQLTGTLWQKSTLTEKLAFLLGVETAITVEHFVNDKVKEHVGKTGKKPISNLSPFEKGWMTVFKDTPRSSIAQLVDDWYAAHPDHLERPVMGVIWFEIIAPQLPANK